MIIISVANRPADWSLSKKTNPKGPKEPERRLIISKIDRNDPK
jgi:hypothetical protein